MPNILEAIGNTSLVPLQSVVPPGCAEILVKLEWENPTGSMKDRMANTVIARAADGGLQPGSTLVEYTGGSTGLRSRWSVPRSAIASDRDVGRVQPRSSTRCAPWALNSHWFRVRTVAPPEADPRHDREARELSREAEHVLERPASQHRLDRRLPRARRGRSGRRPTGAWMHSCNASAPGPREASPWCSSGTILACASWRSSPASRRCCSVVRPARTRSRAWESATRRRCGDPRSWTRWAVATDGKPGAMTVPAARRRGLCSQAPHLAPTSAAIRVAQRLGPGHKVVTPDVRLGAQVPGHDVIAPA